MSWIFSNALLESLPCSQGVEEESSGVISSDGAQCALWNGTPTQPPSWCSDRTIKAFQFSQSGMMFRPLTDDLGEAVLTLFLEAFPARTSAPPEKEQELMGSDQGCGDTWRELLVQYDQSSASWKTAHCLWEEDLPESSVILPPWGMMRGGECWERITLPPLTSGNGSGFLPTPLAQEGPGGKDVWKLTDVICGKRYKHPHEEQKTWPTPNARDWKDTPGMSREGVNPDGSVRKREDQLARRVFAEANSQAGGQVNLSAAWVEWLMGWPLNWTCMEPMPSEAWDAWRRGFQIEYID